MIPIDIRILAPNEANQILPLTHELNEDVRPEQWEQRLIQMLNYGDQCIGVFHDHKLIGCVQRCASAHVSATDITAISTM
jgi:hypothetical protein